jgi:hypothetical protein
MKVDEPVRVGTQGAKVGVVICLGVVIALVVGEVTSVLLPERTAQASTLSPADEVLDVVTAAVESAWFVRSEASNALVVVDSLGRETRFRGADGRLEVRRPDGLSGVLLGGLRDVSFETSTIRRLREGKPVRVPGVAWRRPADVTSPLVLAPGTSISLGMTLHSRAPKVISDVNGVPEQLLRCEPMKLVLDAAGVPKRHEPCAVHQVERASRVRDVLIVALHEGFASEDARPFGPAIASVRVPFGTLSPWRAGETRRGGASICWLCPRGETVNSVAQGSRGNTSLPLDLSEMQAALAPGRAYSIVLSVEGNTPLVIGASPVVDPARSGSAFRARQDAVFDPVPWEVPARLEGIRVYTRTVPQDVVNHVSVILTWKDGRRQMAEVAVAGPPDHTGTPDSWRGVVPRRTR